MTSRVFQKVFDSEGGCVRRTCECGRVWFNSHDVGCFNSEELEELEDLASKDPDKYIDCDHSIGWMEIPFVGDVIYGCPCGLADEAERVLIRNAEKLAEYLNRYSEKLFDKSEKVKVRVNKKIGFGSVVYLKKGYVNMDNPVIQEVDDEIRAFQKRWYPSVNEGIVLKIVDSDCALVEWVKGERTYINLEDLEALNREDQ